MRRVKKGDRFGKYTVIKFDKKDRHGAYRWMCRCDCGKVKSLQESNLIHGERPQCKSCGKTTHGLTGNRLYNIWRNMIYRCHSKNNIHYNNYGGRGIRVCKKWRDDVHSFIEDMKPTYKEGLTLGRIDNDRGYSPDNCRWETRAQQTRNRRNTLGNLKMARIVRKLNKDGLMQLEITRKTGYPFNFVRGVIRANYWLDE